MRIARRTRYLVLHVAAAGGRHRLAIEDDLPAVISSWTSVTRTSPIWLLAPYDLGLPANFSGELDVIFLGPVRPAILSTEIRAVSEPGLVELWLTPGLLNVFARSPCDAQTSSPAIDEIAAYARSHGIPFERWRLSDGAISIADSHSAAVRDSQPLLARLATVCLAERPEEAAIRPALQEFVAISASALTRSAVMAPMLFDDASLSIETLIRLIESHREGKLASLELLARLVTANAALSRFSSQAFSGMPPIMGTECHFWVHSLLGTGSANMALAQLARWVQSVLGEARLPEKVEGLANLRRDVPTLDELTSDQSLLQAQMLSRVPLKDEVTEPVVPLVTYFSGRDGFCSHLQTLSAPLATLAECNSYRSSLMTITHEISHVFVQAVLVVLYPRAGNSADLDFATEIMQADHRGSDWLTSARQLLLEGIFGLEQAAGGPEINLRVLRDRLPSLLANWMADVQETMVHTFDFLYFYERAPEHYVRSIWHTWSAIPGIDFRVREYVMRTLCAISVSLLDRPASNRLDVALQALRDTLAGMTAADAPIGGFVAHAIGFIDDLAASNRQERRWRAFRQEYEARLCIVRLVQIFLYSERLAAALFSDPYPKGTKAYPVYNTEPIGNPLTFLRDRLKASPKEAESMWILHGLAFDFDMGRPHGIA